ncbi:MAG: hypothetical protein ACYC77_11970 [Coriobacteriia bacterium]
MADSTEVENGDGRFAVLNVFGLTLEVSNPRLAELLTMDARSALNTDVRDLTQREDTPSEVSATLAEVVEALPDIVVTPQTPHDEAAARQRRDFRARTEAAGASLGFETHGDGLWLSRTGVGVLTRTVERPVSLAAATHFVNEMDQLHSQRADKAETAVLFIVDSQQTADVFKVAIRQRRLYHTMRTVTVDNLEEMQVMSRGGQLAHKDAVLLLAPVANIDVGEMLSVLNSQSAERMSPEAL